MEPQPALVPQRLLRQVVRAVRARLVDEISDPFVRVEVDGVLLEAELGPLAFVVAEQQRQAELRHVEVRQIQAASDDEEDGPRDRAADARVRAARARARLR